MRGFSIELERDTATLAAALLASFKGHLRLTGTAEDTELTRYLSTAILQFEDTVDRLLIVATVKEHYDYWPLGYGSLPLMRSPVTSFTSLKYYDIDGVQQTWDAANYDTDLVSEPARVKAAYDAGLASPGLESNKYRAVTLEYESGLGAAAANIPADAINAIFVKAAYLYAPARELLPNLSPLVTNNSDAAVARCWASACRRYQWKVK